MTPPDLNYDGIDAPPGGDMATGLQLYALMVGGQFSEQTIFSILACQVACAAHDSSAPSSFIQALADAAREIHPTVPRMRQEQAAAWLAKQATKPRNPQ